MKKTTPIKILAAGSLAYTAICGKVFYEIMNRNGGIFGKVFEKTVSKNEPVITSKDERLLWFGKQKLEENEITNGAGHKLHSYFLKADVESDKYYICAHGYRSSAKGEFTPMIKFMHESGYNVLMVDHRASGKSEGSYITFGYREAEDLLLWVQFLIDRFGEDIKIAIHGISMGSATVLTLCGYENLPKNVKFAVADCGYSSVEDLFSYLLRNWHIPTFPVMNTVNTINKVFSDCSFEDMTPVDAVKKSKTPILFIHGGKDRFVPTEMVYKLYDACRCEKDIYIAPSAGHAESYVCHSEEYEQKFTEFSNKYMEE